MIKNIVDKMDFSSKKFEYFLIVLVFSLSGGIVAVVLLILSRPEATYFLQEPFSGLTVGKILILLFVVKTFSNR